MYVWKLDRRPIAIAHAKQIPPVDAHRAGSVVDVAIWKPDQSADRTDRTDPGRPLELLECRSISFSG